jgi:site-specific recombinase XerD
LTRTVLPQRNAHAMIRRRAAAAGIATKLGNHSFRATGITAYLKNGGTLEKAAQMANHASTRTTQLYDRRREELGLDEVERIRCDGAQHDFQSSNLTRSLSDDVPLNRV